MTDTKASSASQASPHSEGDLAFANAPNFLTLGRIVLVPAVVAALFVRTPGWDVAAGLIFGAAAITDIFDGYIARSRKLITVYGKLLDPLADKFLVVCSLVALQELGRIHPIVVMLLICRELAITGLRALASAEGLIISASAGGKWKTVTQMVAIPFIMARDGIFGIPLFGVGQVLLYVSLAQSLWSAKDYVAAFFRALRDRRRTRRELRKATAIAKRAARAAKRAARRS